MTARNISISLLTASLLGLSAAAVAQPANTQNRTTAAAAVAGDRGQIFSATVTKIDQKNRVVSFKNQDGELDIVAGPEVKNFAQIKVGDRLDVAYEVAVAIELVKTKNNDIRSREKVSDVKTAPAGAKPGMVKTNIVKTTASVEAIDKKKQIVSLKGPKGNIVEVKVNNPELLKGITTKDQVDVTYAEAIAAVISTPKK
ncbi:hypothetical protein ICN28_00590 [Polynucleobacter sp. 30F-ANTBAC]|uniref:hypothetical protein n=1 Tax=Polynucleobacter sp. 30F-ANTBAC TaxID=2689095 RepID=UPI001C0AA068|nr:hypothetical protein [Polynucleobacter sp. 30F-ANTBAC]MBU3599012.1 hypothetical protein [Polynucleobacter sp. 30F-ANTBAC]